MKIDGVIKMTFEEWWKTQDTELNYSHKFTAWNAWLAAKEDRTKELEQVVTVRGIERSIDEFVK